MWVCVKMGPQKDWCPVGFLLHKPGKGYPQKRCIEAVGLTKRPPSLRSTLRPPPHHLCRKRNPQRGALHFRSKKEYKRQALGLGECLIAPFLPVNTYCRRDHALFKHLLANKVTSSESSATWKTVGQTNGRQHSLA